MQFVSLPRLPLPIRPGGDQQHIIITGPQNGVPENYFAQFPYGYPGFYPTLHPVSRMAGPHPGLNLPAGTELHFVKLEDTAGPPQPTFMNTARPYQQQVLQATDTSNMTQTCRMSDIFDVMNNTESSQSLLHGTPPLSVPTSSFLGYNQQGVPVQSKVSEMEVVMSAQGDGDLCEEFLRSNGFLQEEVGQGTLRPAHVHDATSAQGAVGQQQMSPGNMKQGRVRAGATKMAVPRRTSNKPKAVPGPAEAKPHTPQPPTPAMSSAPQPVQSAASGKEFLSSPAVVGKMHGAPAASLKSETVMPSRKMSQIPHAVTKMAAGGGDTDDEKPKRHRKESECTTDGDGADSDVRKFAKLEKNRQSARECRRRKKEYIKDLEQKIDRYEVDNNELGDRLAKAEREKSALQEEIARLKEVLGA